MAILLLHHPLQKSHFLWSSLNCMANLKFKNSSVSHRVLLTRLDCFRREKYQQFVTELTFLVHNCKLYPKPQPQLYKIYCLSSSHFSLVGRVFGGNKFRSFNDAFVCGPFIAVRCVYNVYRGH